MKSILSIDTDPAFIRPLAQAQNEFLQVLLTAFSIRVGDSGLVLEVEFDFECPTVWLRRGKTYIRRQLNPASSNRYQQELEQVLLGHTTGDWAHDDPAFPFRFGNGGTLPSFAVGTRTTTVCSTGRSRRSGGTSPMVVPNLRLN